MSEEKKRKKVAWWVPAFIGFILLRAGIRYASSQGWWRNTFDPNRQTYQTINTGFSVQASNELSEGSVSSENSLNPGSPSQPSDATNPPNPNDRERDIGQRALW
jgi:hypothetical protein